MYTSIEIYNIGILEQEASHKMLQALQRIWGIVLTNSNEVQKLQDEGAAQQISDTEQRVDPQILLPELA